MNKRAIAYAAVCGAALSATLAGTIATVGFRELPGIFSPDTRLLLLAGITLVCFIATAGLCYLLFRKADRLLKWADRKNPLPALPLDFHSKSILVAMLVMLICWLPWIILQYPCAMNGDTYNQLYQFQTSAPTYYSTIMTTVPESYVDHHPVFDTLLFGAFLTLGDVIGSQNLGLFAYSLFQCALTAGGLALSCCYLERLGVPKVFRLITLVFCALFPPIPMWATAMVKDPLNAAVFIYFMVLFAEGIRTRGDVFDNVRMVVLYIVLASLVILTKKSGALVVGAGSLALLLYARQHWKAMALNLVTPLAICLVIVPAVVYPAIGGVASGGKQEAFGFAFQQVVTAVRDNDDLSAEEREAVNAVLDLKAAVKAYEPNIVDPVKRKAVRDAETSDYLHFIGAYFTIGARHVGDYTYSIFSVIGTLIAPGRTFTYFHTPTQEDSWIKSFNRQDINGELHLTFEKPAALEKAAADVDAAWRAFVAALGPFQLPFDAGFYGGWIPLFCLVVCLYGRKANAIALVPIFAFAAIVVIGPASSTRYVLPMLYTTPLMLGLACNALRAACAARKEVRA